MKTKLLILLSSLFIFCNVLIGQNSIYVDHLAATGLNNGSSFVNAHLEAFDAFTAANPGDTIKISKGTYLPSTLAVVSQSFHLPDDIIVLGGYSTADNDTTDLDRSSSTHKTIFSGDFGGDNINSNNYYNIMKVGTLTQGSTIDGITFTHGDNPSNPTGGAILFENTNSAGSSQLTIVHCTFINNSSLDKGGAIYANVSNGFTLSLNMFSCLIEENESVYGGSIYLEGSNDAIINFKSNNNTYTSNNAVMGGSIYSTGGDESILNFTFLRDTFQLDTATIGGSLFYTYETTGVNANGVRSSIDSSFFNSNIARSPDQEYADGGAILYHPNSSKSYLKVQNTTFQSNKSELTTSVATSNGHGGAIHIKSSDSYATPETFIQNCSFQSNQSVEGNGGACYFDEVGAIDLSSNTFTTNSARNGGAYFASSEFSTNNIQSRENSFLNNTSFFDGGGAITLFSSGDMINTFHMVLDTFSNNSSSLGGAISIQCSSSFNNESINCTIDSSYFNGNTVANDFSPNGGAIHYTPNYTKSYLKLRNSAFINNSANFTGFGGIDAKGHGGAIYISGADTYAQTQSLIENCSFQSNQSVEGNGGACYFYEVGAFDLSNNTFTMNEARNGGAYFASSEFSTNNIQSRENSFLNNTSFFDGGGAITLFSSGDMINTFHMVLDTFSNNSSSLGGAISIQCSSSFNNESINCTIDSSYFNNNTVANDFSPNGGAIHYTPNYTKSYLKLRNSSFINNSANFTGFGGIDAKGHGGAIYISGADTYAQTQSLIENCSFQSNQSVEGNGGACYFYEVGAFDLSSNTFTMNEARNGGAYFASSEFSTNNIQSRGNSFLNNTSFFDGGGAITLFSSGDMINTFHMVLDTFSNNSSSLGGAISIQCSSSFNNESINCTIDSSYFNNNTVANDFSPNGGAIHYTPNYTKSYLKLRNSSFNNNSANFTGFGGFDAKGHGGAIYISGADTYAQTQSLIENCSFQSNQSVEGNGGACYFYEVGAFDLSSNTFTMNEARNGGAYFASSEFSTNNIQSRENSFISNTSNNNGGGAIGLYSSAGTFNVFHMVLDTFLSNTASYGGAITINSGSSFNNESISCIIDSSHFKSNTSNSDFDTPANGGAIFYQPNFSLCELIINECDFIQNQAINDNTNALSLSNGGAIHASGSGSTTALNNFIIQQSTFTANKAKNGKGASISGESAGEIYLEGNIFEQGLSKSGGALEVTNETQMTSKNNFYLDNEASQNGGAINITLSSDGALPSIDITLDTFTNNEALTKGGAIDVSNTEALFSTTEIFILIDSSGFKQNTVSNGNGGAIHLHLSDDDNFQIDTVLFEGNTASNNGGALFTKGFSSNLSDNKIQNCTFTGNSATSNGAVWHTELLALIYLSDNSGSGNTGPSDIKVINSEVNASGINTIE